MSATSDDYGRDAIAVHPDVLRNLKCVRCGMQGGPVVWTIVVDGVHFTRCDHCDATMKGRHDAN